MILKSARYKLHLKSRWLENSLFSTTENAHIPFPLRPHHRPTNFNKSFCFPFLSVDSGCYFSKYIYSQIPFPLGHLNKFNLLW